MPSILRKIYVALFGIVLFFPIVASYTGISISVSLNENRIRAVKPALNKNVIKYIKEYNKYFNDNFFGRDFLISSYNKIKFEYFHETPVPDKTFIGKNNFLFYSVNWSGNPVADYQGLVDIKNTELNTMYSKLNEIQTRLKERNITFYLIIAPNKETVYPDKMPDNIKKGIKTSTDIVVSYLLSKKINIIDLRGDLVTARSKFNKELYFKTDTHWNALGAYAGYLAVINNLRDEYKTVRPVYIDVDKVTFSKGGSFGDLLGMMGIGKYNFYQTPILNFEKTYQLNGNNRNDFVTKKSSSRQRAVVFIDSFGEALQPFLSETFGYTRFIRSSKFDIKIIDSDKPDIVLYEVVERNVKALSKPGFL